MIMDGGFGRFIIARVVLIEVVYDVNIKISTYIYIRK